MGIFQITKYEYKDRREKRHRYATSYVVPYLKMTTISTSTKETNTVI